MLFLIIIYTPAHTPCMIHGTLDGIRTHVHRSKAYDVGPLHYKSTMGGRDYKRVTVTRPSL